MICQAWLNRFIRKDIWLNACQVAVSTVCYNLFDLYPTWAYIFTIWNIFTSGNVKHEQKWKKIITAPYEIMVTWAQPCHLTRRRLREKPRQVSSVPLLSWLATHGLFSVFCSVSDSTKLRSLFWAVLVWFLSERICVLIVSVWPQGCHHHVGHWWQHRHVGSPERVRWRYWVWDSVPEKRCSFDRAEWWG